LAGHDAVLDCKQVEQQGINDERDAEWIVQLAGIDRLGNNDVSNESYPVQSCEEENQVANYAVKKSNDSTHDWISLLSLCRGGAQ
jgi:hypothetical protein